jgi:glycosyltransferase involved in cell wall biosynthesis
VEGARVRRLPHFGRFDGLASFPAFFHPVWLREVRAAVQACRPERIVVRDLPLAPLGCWIARRVGCPVIVDMAEPYPEALRSNWRFDRMGGLDHLVRNPRLADAVERWVVRQAPRTLVVAQEAGERLEHLGLARERWTLVHNTPDLSRSEWSAPARARVPSGFEGRTILVFAGILVGDRGVEIALEALSMLARSHEKRVGMIVIGEGPARARYEAHARALGLDDAVRFLGWVDHHELPAHLAAAHLGLLPFHTCTHIHSTLANKLFDYMALGLPVVASDARPMVRVLEATRAGLVFRSGDAADCARVVARLLDDPAFARSLGEHGRKAALETYHWEHDAARLLQVVEAP